MSDQAVLPGPGVDLEVPVLVIGGGPAGLTAALELARRGVPGLLLERRDGTSPYPRAHLLNVRTMETLTDLGLGAQIYAESPPEDRWHKVVWTTSLAGPTDLHGRRIGEVHAWGGGDDAPRYARASPRPFANLPQIRLDSLLWERAGELWPGRVRGGQEVTGIQIEDEGACTSVVDRESGTEYRVRSRYVVAADGGRVCAERLGVQMVGARALMDVASVYFTADLSDVVDDQALLTFFMRPEGHGTMAGALLNLGNTRGGPPCWGKDAPDWSMALTGPITASTRHDDELLVERAREVMGLGERALQVHQVSHWQLEGVVADRFRVGPVFLAGDAAHRHPPTGGLGLNTAVGDSTNLGWKLAAVVHGQAADALLDSYESERQPIALVNTTHSLRNAGRHAPVAAALGLAPGQTLDEGWAEIGRWAAEDEEGAARRARAAAAVAANAEDFSQLGIEAGFGYGAGSIVPDGTPPGPDHRSPTAFTPTARPGHHVPHVWVTSGQDRVSTSDLVVPVGYTLIVSAEHEVAWREAADVAARSARYPVVVVPIADHPADGAVVDRDGQWARDAEVSPGGAVLVRPDRHVAWRVADLPADPAAALTAVVTSLLGGSLVPAASGTAEALADLQRSADELRR